MDLSSSPVDEAFRQEVRAFIRDDYPAELRVANPLFCFRSRWDAAFKKSWILRSSISWSD
jgi:hypothetical protein